MRVRSLVAFFLVSAISIIVACGSESGPDIGNSGKDSGSAAPVGTFQTTGDGSVPTNPGAACYASCEKQGVACGPTGDGCGGLIQCGTCNAPDTCGGGGKASTCGGGSTACKPKTCADYPANACGPLADGCGGIITCGTGCVAPQYCGGGGVSLCGGNSGCQPKTQADCAAQGVGCGPMADGCGGVVQCGDCAANQSCGAGGPSKCGAAGGGTCKPKTCADLGNPCGSAGDGCGGQIVCGTCAAPQTCGGGGTPSVCGGTGACIPKTCQQIGATCGLAGDGCGGTLQCGTCAAPQTCGGGGTPSACGGNNQCVPKTCASYPANACGPVSDGCGGLLTNCGVGAASNCPANQICGGGGVPSVCGGNTGDAGAPTCTTGLCTQQASCSGGATTTLTGTVVSPRTCAGATCDVIHHPTDADPIPNVIVFVPNGGDAAIKPFSKGVQCDQCGGAGAQAGVLVSTTSGADGTFTLSNVPVGKQIPVVIQIGRWRRVFHIDVTNSCGQNVAGDLHLPATQADGDIPLTAIGTGGVDTLECVLRKVGIADSEFTSPNGTGRVQLYQGDDGPNGFGQYAADGKVSWTQLYGSATALANYDQLIFDCNGDPSQASMKDADRGRVRDYLNTGGRLFATHYEYVWLDNFAPFSTTAQWNVDQTHPRDPNPTLGDIDTSFAKGALFASWLGNVGSLTSTSPPKITMNISRHDIDPLPNPPGTGVVSPAQRWISVDPNLPDGTPFPTTVGRQTIKNYVGAPQHYTFNTPWGAAPENQCGRVLFSDFHVLNASVNGVKFPGGCTGSRTDALTPQEKVIEFMLFDLGSCIAPDNAPPPPTCTKQTCPAGSCGQMGDGCGGVLSCGTCTAPQTCGGGGTANVCGGQGCTPRTCAQANATCGPVADGCGGILDCGTCVSPQTCGGGGIANRCGNSSCNPLTCAAQGISCGPAGDGCGGVLQCGDCAAPLTCGGGGSPGVCGNSTCVPGTCGQANCGPVSDGCGGILACGTCPSGQVCGGGGPSKCGTANCTPLTCASANATCGAIGDGCGGQLDCGPCTNGQTCGGGGTPNTCGGCTLTTCAAQGAECGPIGDGCGGILDCGTCTKPGDSCGGGGVAFKCGQAGIK